ncbi:hypothetical protein ACJRO7_028363 [Eucalyptus globulus]|uniref:CLAVATA3/ESR (CLE)-related protein 44 n=1 Tax=Eucalyptus globulus TaxID=34317 RepID=A0ABD3K468_EUCGL
MPLAGSWRLMHTSLLLFVLFSAFHLWACREYCSATATRTLSSSSSLSSSESSLDDHVEVKQVYSTDTTITSSSKEEITLRSNTSFNGRPSASSHAVDNSTEQAFEDSKRAVPSGPDPLHN